MSFENIIDQAFRLFRHSHIRNAQTWEEYVRLQLNYLLDIVPTKRPYFILLQYIRELLHWSFAGGYLFHTNYRLFSYNPY